MLEAGFLIGRLVEHCSRRVQKDCVVNVIFDKYSRLCQNKKYWILFWNLCSLQLIQLFPRYVGRWNIFPESFLFWARTGPLSNRRATEESLIEQLVYHLVIPCRCRSSTTGGRAMAPTGQSINQSVYSGKFASKLFDNVWFYHRRADIFIKFCFYQIFQDVKPAQHLPSILVSFPGMRVNAVRVEFEILGILNTNLCFPLRRTLGQSPGVRFPRTPTLLSSPMRLPVPGFPFVRIQILTCFHFNL